MSAIGDKHPTSLADSQQFNANAMHALHPMASNQPRPPARITREPNHHMAGNERPLGGPGHVSSRSGSSPRADGSAFANAVG
jgi:hypothetical protein